MMQWFRRKTLGEIIADELASARLDMLAAERHVEDAIGIRAALQMRQIRLKLELEAWRQETKSSRITAIPSKTSSPEPLGS